MSSLRDVEADLAGALRLLESRTAYAEVMAESSTGTRLRMDKSTISPQPVPHLAGAVFRAWDGTKWVESASSGLAARNFRTSAEQLLRHLPATRSGGDPPGVSPTGRAEHETHERRSTDDFSREDQVAWAKTCFGWATSVPGIENAFVSLQIQRDERLFLATTGAYRYQRLVRTHAGVTPLAIENGKVEFDYVAKGRTAGIEVLDDLRELEVVAVARSAKELLTAVPAPTGETTVILDPSTTGTFAHESFGHGTEADQLLRGRSYLQAHLGEMVGPDSLTIVDNGAYPEGWGEIYFDDEGQAAQRTALVDRGRFVEVLHDRESAAALHRPPTGNARRADFLSRPFVRMTNTYVEPGDRSFDELVAEAKNGVVMEHFLNGIEDPLGGNMQLKVKRGRLIRNGELTDTVSSMALSGKVLDFLRQIRGIGRKDDFEISTGFCGKGHSDLLVTGAGGPYVLSRAVVGPA
jgi:TldD protein